MAKLDDLSGKKFGRLTVIERAPNTRRHSTMWKCLCDCGNEKIAAAKDLKSGATKSCGCILYESNKNKCVTHGMTGTRIYTEYKSMKHRCYYKKGQGYKNYGGRGITVCEEWLSNFMNFYHWAMNNGYSDSLSLDRIDNNKGYSPDNCRWATAKQQSNNRRTTIRLKIDGTERTLSEWSEYSGINKSTLKYRIKKGWSADKILLPPGVCG